MLENILTNVFGRPKNKSSNPNPSTSGNAAQMTGPFSMPASQMPQPPTLPYPPALPGLDTPTTHTVLPFSQPLLPTTNPWPSLPGDLPQKPHIYPTGTLTHIFSPLDSIPFEAKLTLNNSTNLVSLDQLFRDIKSTAEVVDRADAYLRSSQSDYDFKIEQGLIYN